MNQAIKQKWVDALLSGKFKQGMREMRRGSKYCCLGVLQEVCLAERIEFYADWGRTSYVPPILEEALHLPDGYDELGKLNDSGVPFEMIAGLINEAL